VEERVPKELRIFRSTAKTATAKGARLLRLLDILHLATWSSGWTSKRLADRFGISRRRIFEDIELLGHSGIRLLSGRDGYRIRGANPNLPVSLGVHEILALLRPWGETRKEREEAQRKLAAALPTPLRELFRDTRKLKATVRATPVAPAVWGAVDQGLAEGRLLRLRYRGLRGGASEERVVEPHGLCMNGTGWYLGAWCRKAEGWRLFRMDRVSGAALLSERFEARTGFDFEDYVKSDVGIWVGGALGARIEVLPSHVEAVRSEALARGLPFRRASDGALLEIPRGHLDEAAWWLAPFGEGVRVMHPPALRTRLAKLGRRTAELNGG
jgi:predicted DNA-binding transcriptional regulator YafY